MLSPLQIKSLIETGIEGASAEVRDTTGTGDHFEAVVVAPAFEGLSPVKRHQLVYGALGEAMHGPIHALALRTFTPDQLAGNKA
jgi:acid stress-induced BolA-like protein IbaG/YrbA